MIAELITGAMNMDCNYKELDFGTGSLEVMQGCHRGQYSLIIGKNGGGIVGENISKDRYLKEDEIECVMHFSNISSLNVVINQLEQLKYNMVNRKPFHVKNEFGDIIDTLKPMID